MTDWGFEWTPNDVKYQWYAHGHLPIGVEYAAVGLGRRVFSHIGVGFRVGFGVNFGVDFGVQTPQLRPYSQVISPLFEN